MSDEAPATERDRSADVEPGPPELAHELVNVVSAMRIHLFMVRRLLAADAAAGQPRPSGSERWKVEESLDRLESMVDRVVELATDLDEVTRDPGAGDRTGC
jgi:hypothetical protein